MSERRTAEIKFRCTPSFKADAQAAADAAGESLTEYIENAVRAHRNISNVVVGLIARRAADPKGLPGFTSTNIAEDGPLTFEVQDSAAIIVADPEPVDDKPYVLLNSAVAPINVGGDVAFVQKCDARCKPWEFCSCKAGA